MTLNDIEKLWAVWQFGPKARQRIYGKLAKMLENGMPLIGALEEIRKRESRGGKNDKDALVIMLDAWIREMPNGRRFSDAVIEWIPHEEFMILSAGDESGTLDVSLTAVIQMTVAARKIRNTVLGGIAYPAALFAISMVYLYIFGVKVIPQFANVTNPESWHGAAKSLYIMSGFVRHWAIPLLMAFGLAIAGLLASLPRWRGKLRVFLDERLPPFTVYRLMTGSTFLLAVSALIGAGVSVAS